MDARVVENSPEAGFILNTLKEDIIKLQHKMMTTRQRWRGKYDFYLNGNEHLYVFRKISENERTSVF